LYGSDRQGLGTPGVACARIYATKLNAHKEANKDLFYDILINYSATLRKTFEKSPLVCSIIWCVRSYLKNH
jgi:hypothetical protein